MSRSGDSLREWREAVLGAADELEAACWPLLAPAPGVRGARDLRSRRKSVASRVPHVEAVLDLIHNLRHVAGDPGLDQMIDRVDREVA